MKFTPGVLALLLPGGLLAIDDIALEGKLPRVTVQEDRLERFTLVMELSLPGGPISRRGLIYAYRPGGSAIWTSGVRAGDEVIAINGRLISTLQKGQWSEQLRSGVFTLTIRRKVAIGKHAVFDVEASFAPRSSRS